MTTHAVHIFDSRSLKAVPDSSIDLVVTSPPYPMIAMWDDVFSTMNSDIHAAFTTEGGTVAFELMHTELDKVWREVHRVLKENRWVCINIGDATRTIGNTFRLFPNHARIITAFQKLGFDSLPLILWRKQTNAPNKFMGSGMLPGGAYVTLEHEYILLFRKGSKREFSTPRERRMRRQSAMFWEERNIWFSDVWDFKGTRQELNGVSSRNRSGAFPFELVYRLINMYSIQGDTVLDPFLGTGTTTLAAAVSARSSVGIELDGKLLDSIEASISKADEISRSYTHRRLADHITFIEDYSRRKGEPKHTNLSYQTPVVTSQETDLKIPVVNEIISDNNNHYTARYFEELPFVGSET